MPETIPSSATDVPAQSVAPTFSKRLTALDAFRGATILLMVCVNNGNGVRSYTQLEHSAWDGLTMTDTVFPSFLWMVGVAITLSLQKRLQNGAHKSALLLQVARRSAILYAIGLLIYMFPHFDLGHARILGVLQRIAICYFLASLIYLYTGIKGQILWIAGLLGAYWIAMTWLPVPGYGAGRLDLEGNFAHYIDRIVLGAHNYRSGSWDPEGIVSTIPAVATSLLGIMAGHLLRLRTTFLARICSLFFTGCLVLALGLFWSNWMPVNKKLWSDTFVLVMGGIDFLVLGCFLWFVDELGYKKIVTPLVIVGMNSIAVYTASELGLEALNLIPAPSGHGDISLLDYIFKAFYATSASPENASLLWALSVTASMFALAYLLYRRRWFWRV